MEYNYSHVLLSNKNISLSWNVPPICENYYNSFFVKEMESGNYSRRNLGNVTTVNIARNEVYSANISTVVYKFFIEIEVERSTCASSDYTLQVPQNGRLLFTIVTNIIIYNCNNNFSVFSESNYRCCWRGMYITFKLLFNRHLAKK